MSDIITQEGSFEWAMLQLKQGKRVAREGWNGKNMYLIRNPGLVAQKVEEGDYRALAGVEVGKEFDLLPNIEMCNADGNFVPWVASNADIKNQDWIMVNDIPKEFSLIVDVLPGYRKESAALSHAGYYRHPIDLYTIGSYNIVSSDFNVNALNTFAYTTGQYGNAKDSHFYIVCKFDNEFFYENAKMNVFRKEMTITVDDVDYSLGKYISGYNKKGEFLFGRMYNLSANSGLTSILKNTEEKRFYVKWSD